MKTGSIGMLRFGSHIRLTFPQQAFGEKNYDFAQFINRHVRNNLWRQPLNLTASGMAFYGLARREGDRVSLDMVCRDRFESVVKQALDEASIAYYDSPPQYDVLDLKQTQVFSSEVADAKQNLEKAFGVKAHARDTAGLVAYLGDNTL